MDRLALGISGSSVFAEKLARSGRVYPVFTPLFLGLDWVARNQRSICPEMVIVFTGIRDRQATESLIDLPQNE
jgi:hypothetical protein